MPIHNTTRNSHCTPNANVSTTAKYMYMYIK